MNNHKVRKKNIIPPYLLEYIAETCDEHDKEYVLNTLDHVNKLIKQSIKENSLSSEDDPLLYKNKKLSTPEGSYPLSGK
ncbi:protealysin propeptide domain-containing protein [Xenorhabdus sp. IM139775]|uniref:protealysin propeptide domain-containing protein n=1 Tax=Xenorhabdus sp. IM139775 TaxID=3025876 RepID=UPI0023581137|nr:protealysin propeptide domain-containing protein [Xenorhabdus sp. IM139775]MDC9592707.1 protealysin propeptide domain-containing protein [Xenorhabdus sp. IM139775]